MSPQACVWEGFGCPWEFCARAFCKSVTLGRECTCGRLLSTCTSWTAWATDTGLGHHFRDGTNATNVLMHVRESPLVSREHTLPAYSLLSAWIRSSTHSCVTKQNRLHRNAYMCILKEEITYNHLKRAPYAPIHLLLTDYPVEHLLFSFSPPLNTYANICKGKTFLMSIWATDRPISPCGLAVPK